MKAYTLKEAQQLVKDGKAFIENDIKNNILLENVLNKKGLIGGYRSYYTENYFYDLLSEFKNSHLIHIKLSQIQPDPIPNDILKIVEKYGAKQVITFVELIKKYSYV